MYARSFCESALPANLAVYRTALLLPRSLVQEALTCPAWQHKHLQAFRLGVAALLALLLGLPLLTDC